MLYVQWHEHSQSYISIYAKVFSEQIHSARYMEQPSTFEIFHIEFPSVVITFTLDPVIFSCLVDHRPVGHSVAIRRLPIFTIAL